MRSQLLASDQTRRLAAPMTEAVLPSSSMRVSESGQMQEQVRLSFIS